MKCEYCGNNTDQRICPSCGAVLDQPDPPVQQIPIQPHQQVMQQAPPPPIVINNTYTAPAMPYMPLAYQGKPKSKAIALVLCVFFGYFGAHKFYEGKTGMGIVYIFTCGVFCIGWLYDIVVLIGKPSTYYL